MMKLVILALFFTFVFCQTGVAPTCSNPCFATGTTPCDIKDPRCTTQCKTGFQCGYDDKYMCYNCTDCRTACLIDPCSLKNECAEKYSAKCVADYCGGCKAQYFDATGVEVCKDVPTTCGPVCAIYCPYGNEVDAYGCPTCTCKKPTCEPVTCKMYCQYGWATNKTTGCEICECAPPRCPDLSNCTEKCLNGYAVDNSTGCKVCKCNPSGCVRTCDRYKYAPDGTTTCECECPPTPTCNTFAACTKGFKVDANGCQTTCECNPDTDVCKPLSCALYCKSYKVDANGCKQCECEDTICPAVLCVADCPYGTVNDARTGCPSCTCAPCPLIKCALYCPYDFAIDERTKCPTCTCNKEPVCDSTSVSVATSSVSINASFCDLDCKLGFQVENGCKKCACVTEPVCDCLETDRKSDPIKCFDGKSVSDYTVCTRSEKNICTWIRKLCPIGIVIVMKDGTFTSTHLKEFIAKYQLPEKEITWSVSAKDGKQEITLWIPGEWVPKDTPSKTVADDVTSSVKSGGSSDGYAYIISGEQTSSTSMSSTVIVSIISLLGFLLA